MIESFRKDEIFPLGSITFGASKHIYLVDISGRRTIQFKHLSCNLLFLVLATPVLYLTIKRITLKLCLRNMNYTNMFYNMFRKIATIKQALRLPNFIFLL